MQRLDKHIAAEPCARRNRTSVARQQISKQTLTIKGLCVLRGSFWEVITGQRRSFERVVENWVEFWTWKSNVIEMKWE
jgi:hypothetical protein